MPEEKNTRRNILLLFDVDGTLLQSPYSITLEMCNVLKQLRTQGYTIGIVGGGDLCKQQERLRLMGNNLLEEFDYVFAENGLDAYQSGKLLQRQSLATHLGEENLKQLINFILLELSQLDIPVKRGTFIEYRNGMLNICPVGRNCSSEERKDFKQYDSVHQVRSEMAQKIQRAFSHLKIRCVVTGQISIDIYPEGWDKTYCLRFIDESSLSEIHFFGDQAQKGGNDHDLYIHERVTGHHVKNFEHTIQILRSSFL